MTQYLTILTAFLLLCSRLPAQAPSYLYSHLGTRDGLVSDQVLTVQQDKKGFIWIATHHGIQRYDGHRFLDIRHRPGDSSSIPPGVIYGMAIDSRDRLWIRTGDTRFGYIDVNDLRYHEVAFHQAIPARDQALRGFYVDNGGNILLVAQSGGIFSLRESPLEFINQNPHFRQPAGWKIIHLWQDREMNYWMGCDSGIAKYNSRAKTLSYRNHNTDRDPVIEKLGYLRVINLVYREPGGKFWISAWPETGLTMHSFDPQTNTEKRWEQIIGRALQSKYFELKGVTAFADGSVWLTGYNLLGRLSNDGQAVDIIPSNQPGEFSIRYDGINQLLEDREKNIWVCTDKGLYRFNPLAQKFRVVYNRRPGRDSLITPDVTDILHSSTGKIYVATWGSGVFAYDNSFQPAPLPDGWKPGKNQEYMTWCLLERSNGEIWRGNQNGVLYIYDPVSRTDRLVNDPAFEKSTIRQLVEDNDGKVWFGTQRGAIVVWDPTSRNFTFKHRLESAVSRLYKDWNGNIWVCTYGNGVLMLDPKTGSIRRRFNNAAPRGKNLLSNACADIIQYNDSLLVVAANGMNILNLKTGRFRYLNDVNGFPSNEIGNFATDKKGYLWMTSANGIISHHLLKGKTSNYTSSDGIHTTTFVGSSVEQLKDGRVALGTSHDVLTFDPLLVTVDDYTPPAIVFSGISLMNKALSVDSIQRAGFLEIRPSQNSLVVELSTLTYQNEYPVYYMLEGLDKEWKEPGKLNQALFNYLAPGEYTLKAACRGADGQFGTITSLRISVLAPFYRSSWFYAMLALVLAAILFWLDRLRSARQEYESRMRSDIAGNLHEDVNTTLQNINVLSEIAGMKARSDPEKSREYIYEIQKKSRDMVIAMNDVLWSIDPQNDSITKTIERFHEVADAMLNRHGCTIKINTCKEISGLHLSMKFRHEFIIIYKSAISCLAEYEQAKEINVDLDCAKGFLLLKIEAPGTRIHSDNPHCARALADIKSRARTLGTMADIKNEGDGVTISLKVRTGQNGIQKVQ